jgi:hypothetical protein
MMAPSNFARRRQLNLSEAGRVMKKIIAAVAVLLVLGSCGRTPFPVLETQLDSLKGQPAAAVIKKLGDPNETTRIGSEKVYVWSGETVGMSCTVKVFVDTADKVVHYAFDGNVAGCSFYAHRLDKTYELLISTTPKSLK